MCGIAADKHSKDNKANDKNHCREPDDRLCDMFLPRVEINVVLSMVS